MLKAGTAVLLLLVGLAGWLWWKTQPGATSSNASETKSVPFHISRKNDDELKGHFVEGLGSFVETQIVCTPNPTFIGPPTSFGIRAAIPAVDENNNSKTYFATIGQTGFTAKEGKELGALFLVETKVKGTGSMWVFLIDHDAHTKNLSDAAPISNVLPIRVVFPE